MIDLIGYLALTASLLALSRRDLLKLRWWHLTSSILYAMYGVIISAYPVVFGATLSALIHVYQIRNIYKSIKHQKP